MKYNRREFIKQMGLATGGILLLSKCTPTASRYRVFTYDEAACLIAICEQIIPGDKDPGATEAGVIKYIDKQADIRFPEDKELMKNGVSSLQSYCRGKYQKNFEKLDFDLQTTILQDLEGGKLPKEYWQNVDQISFFTRMHLRTMQGFYGPPRHGGNKDYASYRMLKLDYPLLIAQNRYRK